MDKFQRFGMVRRFETFPVEAFLNPVSDDAAKPGAQLRGLAQMPETFPGGDERFLRDIFTLAKIANPAVGQGADQRLVTRNDVAEGVAVAGQTARDELGVAVFFYDHRSAGYHTADMSPPSTMR